MRADMRRVTRSMVASEANLAVLYTSPTPNLHNETTQKTVMNLNRPLRADPTGKPIPQKFLDSGPGLRGHSSHNQSFIYVSKAFSIFLLRIPVNQRRPGHHI